MKTIYRELPQAPHRCSPDATAGREQNRPARSPRFTRTTLGFWLGAGVLGPGGCILGVCMPYHHPVAVVFSALWWGIYVGCFGASIGALLGLWADQTPTPPTPESGRK
jgi:hypothetical protein